MKELICIKSIKVGMNKYIKGNTYWLHDNGFIGDKEFTYGATFGLKNKDLDLYFKEKKTSGK